MSHIASPDEVKDEGQIHILVSWVMTNCGLIGWYQHFRHVFSRHCSVFAGLCSCKNLCYCNAEDHGMNLYHCGSFISFSWKTDIQN